MWTLCLGAALAAEPSTPQLYEVHEANLRLDRTGMGTLGAWGALNIAGGTLGFFAAEEPVWKTFHATNAAWNTVNVAIAAGGLRNVSRRGAPGWPGTLVDLERDRALYLFMAGLDTGTIATGAALWSRGQQLDDPYRIGIGWSLIVQGSFLLAFDLGMASSKGGLARRLHPWVYADGEQLSLGLSL